VINSMLALIHCDTVTHCNRVTVSRSGNVHTNAQQCAFNRGTFKPLTILEN